MPLTVVFSKQIIVGRAAVSYLARNSLIRYMFWGDWRDILVLPFIVDFHSGQYCKPVHLHFRQFCLFNSPLQ